MNLFVRNLKQLLRKNNPHIINMQLHTDTILSHPPRRSYIEETPKKQAGNTIPLKHKKTSFLSENDILIILFYPS